MYRRKGLQLFKFQNILGLKVECARTVRLFKSFKKEKRKWMRN